VLDIVANLQRSPGQGGTPVDTGWARANWIPVLGQPSRRPAPQPTNQDVSAAAAALSGQQEAAIAGIALSYTLAKGAVTIANNVPYIVALNEGSSKQAPRGFVQSAIKEAGIG